MVREKIRASMLINALQNHVLSRRKMESTQVRAALGLLAKCVPDLAHTEISGPGYGPIPIAQVNVEATDEESMSVYLNMLSKPKG
jgi:hypothetical protein